MLTHITAAEYRGGHRIWLKFNDQLSGEIDLRDRLTGPVFQPLHAEAEFRKFVLDPVAKTIVWENGADLAPEYLHELLITQSSASPATSKTQ